MERDGTVFIFGAGASKAENAPTTNGLLKAILQELENDGRVCNLVEFLREFFYAKTDRLDNVVLPTFEEVLSMVDISLSRQEEFSSSLGYERLLTIRDSLIYSIAKVLERTLVEGGRLHKLFVKGLFENELEGKAPAISFINLNYDILLDNALFSLFVSHDYDVDYCIDFRNTVERKPLSPSERRQFLQDPDLWYSPRRGKTINLLKPHGSLNWLYCPNCNTVKVTKSEKGVLWIWEHQVLCENDHCKQRAMIVPPTFEDAYDNPHFTRIYLKADDVLRRASKVFFVGYSLSDADISLKYLFKRALYSPSSRLRPEISVISYNPSETLTDRYYRLFGRDVEIFSGGFSDLAKNVQSYLSNK
jgi:hypothetical protein